MYIHGLNTYGDGLVHLGPFIFGAMKDKWELAMRAQGFDFVSVRGIGYGTLEEQTERAFTFLRDEGVLEKKRDLVFACHSLGGLIGRALVARPEIRERAKGLFTFGTPHGGAHVTDVALTLGEKAPLLQKLLKITGYDVAARRDTFANFTREVIADFDRRHPVPEGLRCVSLLCEARGLEIGWPLVAVYSRLKTIVPDALGDGFILSSSQRWCETMGPFALDHFAEMGFFFHISPLNRARAKREFDRLTSTVAKLALEATA